MIVQALCALLAAAVAVAGAQTLRLHFLQSEVASARAAEAEADRLHERAASQRTREIDRATQTRIETDRRAAAAAGGDVDRLRHALVAVAQDRSATAPGCADDQATADRLAAALSTCAGLVADGLRAGDVIATQVMGLQAVETP